MSQTYLWHIPHPGARLPRYYVKQDIAPVKLIIMAEQAPGIDCEVDIRDDGVTIFADRGLRPTSKAASRLTGTSKTTAVLPKGATLEEAAEDFVEGVIIEAGSVLSCHEIDFGGASNITVQLEVEDVEDEDDETN